MVPAALMLVAGILFFDRFTPPAAAVWSGFLLCCAGARLLPGRGVAVSLLLAASFLLGGGSVAMNADRGEVPADEELLFELEVSDVASERSGGRRSVAVRILGFEGPEGRSGVRSRAIMWSDGSFDTSFGDRITAFGTLVNFYNEDGYHTLMRRRGYAGTIFLREGDIVNIERGAGSRSLHRTAVERFGRLNLRPAAAAVAGAVGMGDRGGMTPALREAYARSGVSHILAVSGLHIGIIFLVASFLFRFLTILRHGQLIARTAVVVAVWLYAFASGFSPSVVRAAVMFSMLQLSRSFCSVHMSYNTIAAAAFIMLTADPDALFDVSFQLSFAAVTAIIAVGAPLCRMAGLRTFSGRFMWETFVVGSVSFIAAAPIVAHSFGSLSLAGVFVNPVAIVCSGVLVSVAALWVALPLPFLQPGVEAVLNAVAGFQNFVVGRIAGYDLFVWRVEPSPVEVAGCYAVLALIAVAGWRIVLRIRASKGSLKDDDYDSQGI